MYDSQTSPSKSVDDRQQVCGKSDRDLFNLTGHPPNTHTMLCANHLLVALLVASHARHAAALLRVTVPVPPDSNVDLQVQSCRSDVWLLPLSMTADEIEAKFCRDGVCVVPPPWLRRRPTARDWTVVDNARRDGVCTHWNVQRGFGFITVVTDEQEVPSRQRADALFVHRSDVVTDDGRRFLRVGEQLSFSTARNRHDGRLKATAVRGTVEPEEELDAIFEELFGCSVSGSRERHYIDFAP